MSQPGFLNEQTLSLIAQKHGILKESVKGRGTEIATLVFQNAEVFAGAFGSGWLNGRFAAKGKDHAAIGGVPLDLTIGAVGALAAALDAFGPMNSHVAHLAMGVGAGYFYRVGLGSGVKSLEAKQAPAVPPPVVIAQPTQTLPQPSAAKATATSGALVPEGVPNWAR